jgi:hypothetical protein
MERWNEGRMEYRNRKFIRLFAAGFSASSMFRNSDHPSFRVRQAAFGRLSE